MGGFRDLLCLVVGWKSAAAGADPSYRKTAGNVWHTGPAAARLFVTGQRAGQVHVFGQTAGQIHG